MDEYLWPVRNVAEHAYCPRLFYYMEVEGIHLPSADTVKGVAVHNRVDQPSAASADSNNAASDRPQSIRSLTLTSKRLGLTGTVDLTEISDNVATPIEYRKGRPKRILSVAANDDDENERSTTLEAWPTDRVQIALQAILLEEAGFMVTTGVLYYASEKLRLLITIDDQLKAEALQTLEAAKTTAGGSRPLPLINDPRCARCSLQPICLPDEVNQQRAEQAEATSPRRLWPPRDDAIHVVAQQQGVRIGVSGMTLQVTDKEGQITKKIPLANVESLSVLGAVQISTQAVQVLAERGIPIAYLSGAGRLVAMIDPLDSVSAQIRREQVRQLDRPDRSLELSRALVAAKIANQRTLLMRNATNVSGVAFDEMNRQFTLSQSAVSLDALRGHEGQAASVYFEHFAAMFKTPIGAEFDKNGRQRRPPPDPINATISFAYTMLTHECVAALRTARLEPSIGAFHVSRPGRPALALDLMEPFRPLIADSIAVSSFNRGELTEGHFLRTSAGCAFTDAGRRAFFGAYGRRMDTEVTHPVFGYKLSYRRMIILHARMIAAWLLNEIPTLAFLTTR